MLGDMNCCTNQLFTKLVKRVKQLPSSGQFMYPP